MRQFLFNSLGADSLMRIATWNVNSIKVRLPQVEAWIKEHQPDILLLQELKCLNEDFPLEPLGDLGYNIEVLGQKTYNGVAVLSKTPIEDIQGGLPGFEDDQARYLEAFTGGLRVVSVYVPNGMEVGSDKFVYKLKFMQALETHVKDLLSLGEPFVIGGDYNIAPYPEDVHTPNLLRGERILCSQEEVARLRRLLNLGLTDALRALYPAHTEKGRGLFTWWDYRGGSYEQNKGFRIDHLLLSPQAADLLEGGGIDHAQRALEKASDHVPVWILLNP